MEHEHVYLLQEREFKKTDEPIYKIGRTKQIPNKRMYNYPKNSILFSIVLVSDCINTEKNLLDNFDLFFKKRKDIGYEYFEGPINEMVFLFNKISTKEYCINFDSFKFEKSELNEPKKLKTIQSNEYRNLKKFILDEIFITKNSKHTLTTPQIYNSFLNWKKNNKNINLYINSCSHLENFLFKYFDFKDTELFWKIKSVSGKNIHIGIVFQI